MNSFTICSHCLRALRRSIRQEGLQLTNTLTSRPRQPLFTASAGKLRATTQTLPEKQPSELPYPPTTAGTVTSNLTATPPDDLRPVQAPAPPTSQLPPRPDLDHGVPVAEMQRKIQTSLQRQDLSSRLAQGLRKTAKSTTQTYITYGETDVLFKTCAKQADYFIPEDQRMQIVTGKGPPKAADGADLGQAVGETWWFNTVNLPPTFSTWSSVTFLHMYIMTVRLRALQTPAAFQSYHRYLIENFSQAAEDKMLIQHNMSARGIRNKYLKDLFLQWRGNIVAYDEGLVKGDAVLGAAVWRNLFRGQEDVDWEKVVLVVGFMRKVISKMGYLSVTDLMTEMDGPKGLWELGQRDAEEMLQRDSKGLTEPFKE